MNIPSQLKYTKSHEWVAFLDEESARIGLTDYAQNALGGIVFASLPAVGDALQMGESLGEVESVKSVSDVFAPFTCVVRAVHEAVLDEPEKINSDPYGSWLIEVGDITESQDLMTPEEYGVFCGAEE